MGQDDTPQTLFQAHDQTARDIKIAMIKARLARPMPAQGREKFEAALAELQGEKPTGKPVEDKPAPSAAKPVEKKPEPGQRTVKIWTPDGEIEVPVGGTPSYTPKTAKPNESLPEGAAPPIASKPVPSLAAAHGTQMASLSLVPSPKTGAGVQGVDASPLPPTRTEKELMILCGFKSPEELAKFLNSPDAPDDLRRICPPDYAYQEVEEQGERKAQNELAESLSRMPQRTAEESKRNAGTYELRDVNPAQTTRAKDAELWRYAPVVLSIIALLMAAFSHWHYAFYMLLRLGVCAVSVYWTVEMFKQQQTLWAWALGANAVLFNPVFRLSMARSDWQIINLLDALFLAIWTAFSAYGNSGRIGEKKPKAFRPKMSERLAGLTPDQYKAEVLAQTPTAVYKRQDAQYSGPEFRKFSKFLKHIDIEHGYMDLSEASDEERRDYEEYCKREAQGPPDVTYHLVVLKENLDSLRQMSTLDAQSASLGRSSVSEDDAWSDAWYKLKIAEDQRRSARILMVIGLLLFALALAFASIWEVPE